MIEKLCLLNAALIEIQPPAPAAPAEPDRAYRIRLLLKQTPAPFRASDGAIEWRPEHTIEVRLDRWFPAVPLEIYIREPPFHPNISADDGFVCLWADYDSRRTIVDGVVALRNVLTCNAINQSSVHVMQPEALAAMASLRASAYSKLRLPESGALTGPNPTRVLRFDR